MYKYTRGTVQNMCNSHVIPFCIYRYLRSMASRLHCWLVSPHMQCNKQFLMLLFWHIHCDVVVHVAKCSRVICACQWLEQRMVWTERVACKFYKFPTFYQIFSINKPITVPFYNKRYHLSVWWWPPKETSMKRKFLENPDKPGAKVLVNNYSFHTQTWFCKWNVTPYACAYRFQKF